MPTHTMLGQSIGLEKSEIAELSDWENSACFDAKDQVVLKYTDSLTRNNFVSDELYDELKAHFDEKQIMKLCVTVTLANLTNRVHATFRTDVDQPTLDAVADAPFCLLEPQP